MDGDNAGGADDVVVVPDPYGRFFVNTPAVAMEEGIPVTVDAALMSAANDNRRFARIRVEHARWSILAGFVDVASFGHLFDPGRGECARCPRRPRLRLSRAAVAHL